LAEPDAQRALLRLLSGEPGWVDLQRFALARNLSAEMAAELWRTSEIVRVDGGSASFSFGRHFWQTLVEAVREALAAHHQNVSDSPGLEENRLRLALGIRLPPGVFSAAMAAMAREESVLRDGPWLRLPGHTVRLTPAGQRLWESVQPLMERARFQPPRVRDFAQTLHVREGEVRQLLLRLVRMGILVEVAHDHFYQRMTVAELAAAVHLLAKNSQNRKVTVAAFRDRIGTGRKLAIQILEFFDRSGITVREGDLRRTREDRLARFGSVSKGDEGGP
jgi:selenocysteine-specific elongation factor